MPQLVLPKNSGLKKKLSAEEWKKKRERDHKMVKGIFRFLESPGGTMQFAFKKWAGDEVLHYSLTDGEIVEVPLMVAKHLNQNCQYPIHKYNAAPLDKGGALAVVDIMRKRCTFESLDFMMDEYDQ